MATRRPAGMKPEHYLEAQLRAAREAGAFDNLPGAGKPIPDLQEPHDDFWWMRKKLKEEDLSTFALLPESLKLGVEVERFLASIGELANEKTVREKVDEINDRIRKVNATMISGPASTIGPLDPELVIQRWRDRRKKVSSESS